MNRWLGFFFPFVTYAEIDIHCILRSQLSLSKYCFYGLNTKIF